MQLVAPAQQLLAGIAANITTSLTGSDGEPAVGLVATVTVARADGTAVYTNAAATDNADGTYSLAATATDLAALDLLVATWKVGGVTRATTAHEVVGGYYFTREEVATVEQGRANPVGLDHATLRAEVEAEAERIAGVAFVPRYRRITLDTTGGRSLLVPDPMPRTLRSVRVYASATDYTAFTAAEIAAVTLGPSGELIRRDSGVFGYPTRSSKLIVEYEHGYDRPPADLKRAAIRRYRVRSTMGASGIPDRAVTYTAENGATYRLATAGELTTGDPDVDAIYGGYAFKANRFGIG